MSKRIKCRSCRYLDFDFFEDCYVETNQHFCGIHGRARIDPDGEQVNLNHRGSCGYSPKPRSVVVQLTFDF